MRVGFIGLGTMGANLALNLQRAGHQLVINDIRPDSGSPHLAAGATWADTPRAVAAESEVVFTSLPGPPEVESVALGPDGLIEGMHADSAYFDLSTNSPLLIRTIQARFAEQGVHVLDAPISGGPAGAKSGKLAIWVGGDETIFARYRAVLEAMGDKVMYVGPIGAGCVTKLVHNSAGYAIQTALAEAFTMGVKAGVEPLALFEAIRQGATGRMRTFDRLVDQFLPRRYEPAAFSLRLARKDVTLATDLGRELGVPMRLINLALEELTEATNRGWSARDSRVAMLLQEERAGVHIEVDDAHLREALARGSATAGA